jgi:hypothetical protein
MRISIPVLAAVVLVFAFAAPAGAAKYHRHVAGYAAGGPGFHGGVMRGPLYNGQDYLGNDPDPNIRAYLLRDLSSRYGGGR